MPFELSEKDAKIYAVSTTPGLDVIDQIYKNHMDVIKEQQENGNNYEDISDYSDDSEYIDNN